MGLISKPVAEGMASQRSHAAQESRFSVKMGGVDGV